MGWKRNMHRLGKQSHDLQEMCDSCEKFLASYIVSAVSDPYEGSQWCSILCGGCARKEAKEHGLQGPWEKA